MNIYKDIKVELKRLLTEITNNFNYSGTIDDPHIYKKVSELLRDVLINASSMPASELTEIGNSADELLTIIEGII